MKKKLNNLFVYACFIIALLLITSITKAQQSYPKDTASMSWIYKIYTPGGSFLETNNQAKTFFQQNPDYDTIAEIKNSYLDWNRFWQHRSHWVDSATEIGDMNSALKAMSYLSNTEQMTTASPYPSDWKLVSPTTYTTQNLGIITCTWAETNNSNHILAGTEASGLWETQNGGTTWNNITTGNITGSNTLPIGFGVSSVVVKKGMGYPVGSDVIAITTFLPTTELTGGHSGLGLLVSRNGGLSWKRYLLPLGPGTGPNISEMSWKVINAEGNNTNFIYASCQSKVYKIDIVSVGYSCNLIFDLQTVNGGISYCFDPSPCCSGIKNRIRDMAIVEKNNYKTLFITTDGFISNQTKCNAKIFYTNLNSNPLTWTEIVPTTSSTAFIDNISVEGFVESLTRKCFFAYDIIQLDINNKATDNETFYIDKYQATDFSPTNIRWVLKIHFFDFPQTQNRTHLILC